MSATPASIEPKLSGRANVWRFSLFGLAPARLRVLGLKSALSVLDQGLTSGAGFAVNLVLARWLAAPVYGAFAVAFSTTLFTASKNSTVHNKSYTATHTHKLHTI